jgi:hypothetical protein
MEVIGDGWRSLVGGEQWWVATSEGGGRQIMLREGRTRERGAQGMVKSVKERLEQAVRGSACRAGRCGGDGPEGLSGPELEGSQRCTGEGWSSRRRRLGRGVAGGGCTQWTGVRRSMSA